MNANGPLYQDVGGRIPHQQRQAEPTPPGLHRQVQLTQRAMDAMGIDHMVIFPTPMLSLGMHPQVDVEVALAQAYNRWLVEKILPQDPRQVALLYLPFNDPDACVECVEEFAGKPGVVGFTVTSTRHKPVWHNSYMRLYAALQDTGMPLGFHAGFTWADPSFAQINRFIGMHALSFAHFNMVHMTNWVLNGIPERFPKLKVIWIESGLAWIPFIMQRLDSEYMMRTSECPLLKRRPSEYMQEMYYTSQPLERSNMKLTQATFEAIHADTQLLYASDWPHWDFDAPSSITKLPFLNEQSKRNILGLSAAKLFGLEVPRAQDRRQAARPGARAGRMRRWQARARYECIVSEQGDRRCERGVLRLGRRCAWRMAIPTRSRTKTSSAFSPPRCGSTRPSRKTARGSCRRSATGR